MSVYKIPELKPLGEDGLPYMVSVAPIVADAEGTAVRKALCDHHKGSVSAYCNTDQEALVIIPPPGQPDEKVVSHLLEGSCCRCASRTIMCHDYTELQPIEVQCFAHYVRPDDHPGYIRLGHTEAPDPARSMTITLSDHNGQTEDLSWDEESGRVCMLYIPLDDTQARVMLCFNLLQHSW